MYLSFGGSYHGLMGLGSDGFRLTSPTSSSNDGFGCLKYVVIGWECWLPRVLICCFCNLSILLDFYYIFIYLGFPMLDDISIIQKYLYNFKFKLRQN